MAKSLNAPVWDRGNLRGDTIWDALYHLLVARVRYLVCSSHISLWCGQEEDIIADIVQEAMMRTFRYTTLVKERGVVPYKSLKRISVIIADKCYQEMRRRDGQFVRIPLPKPSSEEYAVLFEQVDQTEIVLEKKFREVLLVGLAHKIAAIPTKQRTALLIELANYTHFNAQPSLMQNAFLEAEIQLQDYQQPLPEDPIERRMHRYQLELACKQIMKNQKKQEQQNTMEVVDQGQESTSSCKEPNADAIQNDPKLAALARHLDATAPFAATAPAFRQALRDQLFKRLAAHWTGEAREKAPEQPPGAGNMQQHTEADAIDDDPQSIPTDRDLDADNIQAIEIPPARIAELVNGGDNAEAPNNGLAPISSPEDLELDNTGNNPELAHLAAYLHATAPSAVVDPVFRNRLREKLLGTSAERYVTGSVSEASDNMEEIEFETMFQESLLVSLVHEIADFPDEERTALLIDLANNMRFEVQPARLQQAFLEGEIRLQDYESLLPDDPIEWRNHNFFLNLAYKRVAELQVALCTSGRTG